MKQVDVYNLQGDKVGTQELNADVFAVKVNEPVVHQVYVAQQANSRQVVAHTKTRGEIKGGGRKPWRQKGTGRARHGSIRSPLWRGGGITFGPRNDRNYTKQVNQSMKRTALHMVLSDKVSNEKIVVVDSFASIEGKTKQLLNGLQKLPVGAASCLVVLSDKQPNVVLAGRNLPQVSFVAADSLNIGDVLHNEFIIIEQAGVSQIR